MRQLARGFAEFRRRAWFARRRGRFTAPAARRTRLFVDVSVIAREDARTGIQRVVRALWLELSRRRHPGVDFCPVYAGAGHGYLHARWGAEAERPTLTRQTVVAQPGDQFLGLDLAAHYVPHCAEQLAEWRRAGVSINFVVYDLLPLSRPDWFNRPTVRHFRRWFAAITAHGDRLLCISDAVAGQVRDRLGTRDNPEIGRIFLSGDLAHSRPSTGVCGNVEQLLKDLSGVPTLLMVGTVEPRKGHAEALRAMEYLWAERGDKAPSLLILGKAGWKTDELQQQIRGHREFGRRLQWVEGASDEALERAYKDASALLLATRSEGFGLPLVEATRHRKWVLARDLPVFREQNLGNVHYFRDDRPPALAASIELIMAAAARSAPPVQQLPTWSECADRLLSEMGIDSAPNVTGDEQPSMRVTAVR